MDVVYAVDTAQVPTETCGLVLVRKGEHWSADDAVVAAMPSLFSADPRYGLRYSSTPPADEPPVEQATAGPGERRNVRRG